MTRVCAIAATNVISFLAGMFLPSATETAVANGDTRTIYLHHAHRNESIAATYRVNGHYDTAVLQQLNHFLRDWRNDDEINMDPRLFDVVWEVYRTAGANGEIQVLSAYRSPETNAMLRRRSRAVAEHSQHMLGKAMDTTMPDMSMEKLREIGMRMQRGGVGYYPTANFVHLDVGSVRHWPRMNYDQLVRLFPDGKTVHIPSNGQPLARYEEARAEIEANGGMAPSLEEPKSKGFFAWLFGGGNTEDDAEEVAAAVPSRPSHTRVAGRGAPPPSEASEDANYVATAAPPTPQTLADRYGARRTGPDAAPISAQTASSPASQQVASFTPPMPPVRKQVDSEAVAADDAATFGNVSPLPPKRPMELMMLASVPIPPARPAAVTTLASLAQGDLTASIPAVPPKTAPATKPQPVKPDQIATLISTRDPEIDEPAKLGSHPQLPTVITQGSADASKKPPSEVLAYAPSAVVPSTSSALAAPLPGLRSAALKGGTPTLRTLVNNKHTAIVAARLDGSNFRSLTSDASAVQTPSESVLGAVSYGLRAAARFETGTLSNKLSADYVAQFANSATDLDTEHFSGNAIEPLPSAASALRRIAASVK